MRKLFYILTCLLAIVVIADARTRTTKDVEKEQRQNQEKIEQTEQEIRKNDDNISRQLNRLNSLNATIELRADTIARLQSQIDSISHIVTQLDDSIVEMTAKVDTLRKNYSQTLRELRARRQSMSDFAFIFSANTFSQAWSRMRYLQQMAKLTKRRAEEIKKSVIEIDAARQRQEQARADIQVSLARIEHAQNAIIAERKTADGIVAQLKRSGKELNNELKRRRDLAVKLDRELNQIIEREIAERKRREEEARKEAERQRAAQETAKKKQQQPGKEQPQPTTPEPPKENTYAAKAEAERKLTGSFEANKGQLLFPVAGRYTVVSKFGQSQFSSKDVKTKVTTENIGIDIEVPAGTQTRSVFDGEVIAIFVLAEYHNVVMVGHGNYTTIYAGIDALNVRKGDKVKAGQVLGTLYVDKYDNDRTILNFQVRRGIEKLDPLNWVK